MKRLIALFLLALILCGCGQQTVAETTAPTLPPINYSYTTQSVTCSEGQNLLGFRKDVEVMETDLAGYGFEKSIPQAEREDCVEATEALLRAAGLDGKPMIYVLSSYDGIRIQGNTLYTGRRDWHSAEYGADVLTAACGGLTHYGLTWGWANVLTQAPEEMPFTAPQVAEIGDLNLLCFDPAFASEEDIRAAKSLALGFTRKLLADNGDLRAMLTASNTTEGMEALSDALEAYYRENGFDYRPGTLRFGQGGASVDYIVDTDLAQFCVSTDWADVTEYFPETFLHSDYGQTREFFHINLRQMEQYQALFGLDNYNNDLLILIANRVTYRYTSFFEGRENRIDLVCAGALMHEYIHALTYNRHSPDMELWAGEAFAEHFERYYNHYGVLMENAAYQDMTDTPKSHYAFEYREKIGRPIDLARDFEELDNIFAYSRGYTHPSMQKYYAGAPFIGYLVKLYGVEEVTQHFWGDHRDLPKSTDDLAADWAQYLEDNYGDYSEYRP